MRLFMNIYIMRHGTTVWNEKGITQGRTNNRLSKAGIALVEDMAQQNKNIKIDAIICSPLMRTVQTANIMNRYHNVKIFKDELLTEIDQGIFSKRKWSSLTDEEKEMKQNRPKNLGMESYPEAYQRAAIFLQNLPQKYPFKDVLIVTHNCTATFLEDILTHRPKDFKDASFLRNFKNAELKKFALN